MSVSAVTTARKTRFQARRRVIALLLVLLAAGFALTLMLGQSFTDRKSVV